MGNSKVTGDEDMGSFKEVMRAKIEEDSKYKEILESIKRAKELEGLTSPIYQFISEDGEDTEIAERLDESYREIEKATYSSEPDELEPSIIYAESPAGISPKDGIAELSFSTSQEEFEDFAVESIRKLEELFL